MRVLVTYGSTRGGTDRLAHWLAEELTARGHTVDLCPAKASRHLGAEDAVVVGALYAGRWHPDARRFVRRHRAALSTRPVWFFSSGPLGDEAAATEAAPVPQVARLMAMVGARGHRTFGGRLDAGAKGFLASKIARRTAGDWRDRDDVAGFAAMIDRTLREPAQVA
jgi:menaquinone-dependent protoporphyrinogen oxidase